MKLRASVLLILLLVPVSGIAAAARERRALDAGWRFFKGDAPAAASAAYDDSKWRMVDVPHDWSIEGPLAATHPTGGGGGFLPAGIGWYRKTFALPREYSERRIFVEFDGVMANSDVWINGAHLGRRPYGYVSFGYELTRYLRFGSGQTNVLAVRADNSGQPASRWYTGAGIYRHVRLVVTHPVHFVQWGAYVTTPQISARRAFVRVQSMVTNQSKASRKIELQIALVSAKGKTAAVAQAPPRWIAPGQTVDFEEQLTVLDPALWQGEHPHLYQARLLLRSGSRVLDEDRVFFGIREARFEPDTGFWLNGRNIKLKGVCLHHDGGAFGAAVPLRVWEMRLEQLRRLGVNAIRTAHNPPAPEFLSLCDRMGFLVMDELFDCWTVAKMPFDYHRYFNDWAQIDVRDTVLRDRNHPSIILYSAGNEIHDTPKADLAKRILASLVEVFHRYDGSRPVTQGLFRPNVSRDYDNGLADLLDVVGTNYRDLELLAAHAARPGRRIVGTEQRHDRDTWLAARDHAQHAGQFLWSGIDYLGESPRWPIIGAGSGLLDRTGAIKPMAYERQSWWSEKPVVHCVRRVSPTQVAPADPGFAPLVQRQSQFADWTPLEPGPHPETVEVYSNCEEAELLLNGRSLGSRPRHADDAPRVWTVAWEAGTLRAIGRNHGVVVAEHQLRTARKPARIRLTVDRSGLEPIWDDVAFVTAAVTDQYGEAIPGASDLISFSIQGPGFIAAVDNGDNRSTESFQALERRAFQGRCHAMIKTNAGRGKILVTASAPGLASGSVRIAIRGLTTVKP